MTGPVVTGVSGVARVCRGIRWWFGSVLGDDAYRRYVEHLRRAHPDAPVPDERAFWRQRYAEEDANPAARCC